MNEAHRIRKISSEQVPKTDPKIGALQLNSKWQAAAATVCPFKLQCQWNVLADGTQNQFQ